MSKTCVLKVNINCCKSCPQKVEKALLKINGVQLVDVDLEKRLVSVTGKVDPTKLIKILSKIGKKAELLSYGKEPRSDEDHVEGQFKNMNIGHDKKNVRQKKTKEDEDCCCHDDFGHEIEDYVAPKESNDHVCRDVHCKLHNRNTIIRNGHIVPPRDNVTRRDNVPPMIWHHSIHSNQHFYGGGPPGRSNYPGLYREEPQPPPYGHFHPRMPPPLYGGYHLQRPMPGPDNFTEYFSDESARVCSIM